MEKSKICVCIEGQLRGGERCCKNIKKYLIDYLDADLICCIQNHESIDNNDINFCGRCVETMFYNNPVPNFSTTFNNLCEEFGIEKDSWKKILFKYLTVTGNLAMIGPERVLGECTIDIYYINY